MDEKAVAVITTIVVGFLGSTFLGALLNWPDAENQHGKIRQNLQRRFHYENCSYL